MITFMTAELNNSDCLPEVFQQASNVFCTKTPILTRVKTRLKQSFTLAWFYMHYASLGKVPNQDFGCFARAFVISFSRMSWILLFFKTTLVTFFFLARNRMAFRSGQRVVQPFVILPASHQDIIIEISMHGRRSQFRHPAAGCRA